jgi:formylglycine-generating enzyme required for sulfatase activity
MPQESPPTHPTEGAADDSAPRQDASERITELLDQLTSRDRSKRRQAEAELAELGQPAADRLLQAVTDTRVEAELRRQAGILLGRIGDPRLPEPDHLGPMVEVPGGPFLMGGAPGEPESDTNALPQHEVDVPTFLIGRYPVTNRAYAQFVAAGGYEDQELWLEEGWAWRQQNDIQAPHYWKGDEAPANVPVVGVSWYEAMAFTRWLTVQAEERDDLKPSEVVRLPTEAEWEKAARGGLTLDRRRARPNPMSDRRYPWGDAFFATVCNTAESGLGGTTPVGMFADGASPYGVEELGGNVMEWCSSRPTAYPYNGHDGRELLGGGVRTYRSARGGAWPFQGHAARCAYRHWNHCDFRGGMIGLRVVRGRPVV